MLKKIAFFLIVIMVSTLFSAQATVTITRKVYGEMSTYHFTFTDGGQDTAIVVPSGANYFNIDSHNALPNVFTFDTGEATADSVRWTVQAQVKNSPSGSWITIKSYADTNSTSRFTHVWDFATYGYWPLQRWLMIGAAAKNAEQAVTGEINFKKD